MGKNLGLRPIIACGLIFTFLLNSFWPLPQAYADGILALPKPGAMIALSPAYQPVMIKGLTVNKANPFLFDFIVDVGQDKISAQALKKEGEKLIKYFLAGLAIPDKDVWVNLSPYEKSRIIPETLSQTDMGRDLLEQDYILKQITASLIYPESKLGKIFWDRVYAKAQAKYGTSKVPINTFNKVWIMADRAQVFERHQTVFVVDCHLKVMLQEDYLALSKHQILPTGLPKETPTLGASIVRSIILPELEKEVNQGKNFANLRQIFNSIILSSWYKRRLKESLLNLLYANKLNIKGIKSKDDKSIEQIYAQYIRAYKKGVFNYIKEDIDAHGVVIPRKYFSGGVLLAAAGSPAMITDWVEVLKSFSNSWGFVSMKTNFINHMNNLPLTDYAKDPLVWGSLSAGALFLGVLGILVKNSKKRAQSRLKEMQFIFTKIELLHALEGKILKESDKNDRIKDDLIELGNLAEWFLNQEQNSSLLKKELKNCLNNIFHNENVRRIALEMEFLLPYMKEQAKEIDAKVRKPRLLRRLQYWKPKPVVGPRALKLREITQRNFTEHPLEPNEFIDYKLLSQIPNRLTVKAHQGMQRRITFLIQGQTEENIRSWYLLKDLGGTFELVFVNKGKEELLGRFTRNNKSNPQTGFNIDFNNGNYVLNFNMTKGCCVMISEATKNPAMNTMSPYGGIDLSTEKGMKWQISKEGQGVEMDVNPAMMSRIKSEGIESLSPVITKVTPITSIWPLLGAQAPQERLAHSTPRFI